MAKSKLHPQEVSSTSLGAKAPSRLRKPWYKSKTLWFNAVVASLAALEAVANVLQPLVPGNVYAYGLVVLTMGNAVLRVITTEGLKL